MQILKDEFPVWTVSTREYCQKNHCKICQRNQLTTSQKIGQPQSVIKRQEECPSTAFLYPVLPWKEITSRTGCKEDSCCDLLPFPSYANKPIISLGVKAPLVLSSRDRWKQQRNHPPGAVTSLRPVLLFPKMHWVAYDHGAASLRHLS